MANLTAVIGADTSKFVSEIKSAQEMLKKYVSSTESASETVNKNTSVTNEQVNAYKRVVKQLEKVASGNLSTTQQTKALETQVRELKIQWANLSTEAKNSDFGKSISSSLSSASKQLDTLKSQIDQTTEATRTSTNSTDGFSGGLGTLIGVAKKVAPVIGGIVTVQKTFTEVVNGSQTTADAFSATIYTAKNVLGEFASAISTFDFSVFVNGLDSIIQKGYDAAAAIDQLGNTIMSYNVKSAKANQKLAAARAVLSDPNSTKEQITQAKKNMSDALNELKESSSVLLSDYQNALITEVNARGGALTGEGAIDILDKWLEVDTTANRQLIKDSAKAGYEAYVGELRELNKKYSKTENVFTNGGVYSSSVLEKTPEYTNALNELNEKYKEQVAYHILLEKYTDDELNQLGQTRVAMININGQIDSYVASMNKLNNKKLPSVGGNSGSKSDTDKLAETVKALREQNEQLGKLQSINVPLLSKAINPTGELAGTSPFEDFKKKLADFEEYYKQTMDRMSGYSAALYGISDIFSALSGVVGESAAQWMNFANTATQAIARVIPEIQSLILANESKAIAEGTANAAAMPFPANMLAITSIVAQILAVFAALPKFAKGGIVGGSTSIGDFNIARVNSGEMILNSTQQKRLFSVLSGAESMNTTYKNSPMPVEFRIKGTELVGVINNLNHKKSKI